MRNNGNDPNAQSTIHRQNTDYPWRSAIETPNRDPFSKIPYNQSMGDIPLISSGVLLIYIKSPDNIQVDDIGTTVSINVFTNNAQYITETNVESATSQ